MTKTHKITVVRIAISILIMALAYSLPVDSRLRVILFMSSYIVIGYNVILSAIRSIINGQLFNETFLMSIATIGALIIKEYPEASAVMIFFQIGEIFEQIAIGKSRRSIAELMDLRPDYAMVVRGGIEERVDPEDVSIGELIIIRPSERIPLDGIIVEGSSLIDAKSLTGESLPQDKVIGDSIISGCVNITGVLTVEVTSIYEESTVSRILELVENSVQNKARTENFITRFSRCYTPAVIIMAMVIAILPPLIIGGGYTEWINRALIMLVVSCPCALVISIPLTFFGGIGGASRRGILIKGSNYMEALAKLKVVVFDKTGTLTVGDFFVTDIHPIDISEDELMRIATLLEYGSTHPIGRSIIRAYGKNIDISCISNVSILAGLGMKGDIGNQTYYIGNGVLMDNMGIEWKRCDKLGTQLHLSEGDRYLGHIVISDRVKAGVKSTIENIRKQGIERIVMLTGDISQAAESVASEIGIKELYSQLLPNEKLEYIDELIKDSHGVVAYVGDGINDAPSLSRADVGISMGALGSDAAIEAADVVLMDDNPMKIVEAINIARKTLRIAKQNIIFSLIVKLTVVSMGALGIGNLWMAVFADVGVMMIAIINSTRMLRIG